MTQVFAAIVAVCQAIPVLNSWLEKFFVWYAEREYQNMKSENRDALRKAIVTHDQRPIEETIGSPVAGEPSGVPGSVFVPHLPGVPEHIDKKEN